MNLYADFQRLAKGLLSDFDQGGLSLDVYSTTGGTAWNPGTPTYTPTPFRGVAATVKPQEYMQDTQVQATDLVVTMPGSLAPKMQDRVTINGEAHSIIRIDPKPAAGLVVAWKVVVRK